MKNSERLIIKNSIFKNTSAEPVRGGGILFYLLNSKTKNKKLMNKNSSFLDEFFYLKRIWRLYE